MLRSIIWSIPYGNSITLCDLLRLRTIYDKVKLAKWLHSDARLSEQLANYLIMMHFSRPHGTPIAQFVGENLMLHRKQILSYCILFRSAHLHRCDSFADDEEKLHIIKMHLQEYIPSSLQVCNLQFHLSSEQQNVNRFNFFSALLSSHLQHSCYAISRLLRTLTLKLCSSVQISFP